jgi:hypothetical protein
MCTEIIKYIFKNINTKKKIKNQIKNHIRR